MYLSAKWKPVETSLNEEQQLKFMNLEGNITFETFRKERSPETRGEKNIILGWRQVGNLGCAYLESSDP